MFKIRHKDGSISLIYLEDVQMISFDVVNDQISVLFRGVDRAATLEEVADIAETRERFERNVYVK